jgi:hypothetical protein
MDLGMDVESYYASLAQGMLLDPPGMDVGSYYASLAQGMLLDPPEAIAWRMDGDVEPPLWSHS